MPITRLPLLLGLFAANADAASWVPQWTALWEREPANSNLDPIGVLAVEDGGLFAAVQFNRANRAHLAVMRFGNEGSLAWVRGPEDGAVGSVDAVERLRSGRLAVLGTTFTDARVFVSVHGADDGALLWQRESAAGSPAQVGRGGHALVENAQGELLVALSDATTGDYVVLRYAADGTALPIWRWHAGADVRVTDIAAPADGGAVVTGVGEGLDGGYATVRFDAAGTVRFHDLEPGDHGSPLGPAYVAVDGHDDIVVAGTPEDGQMGVPETTVWKLDAFGTRLWKRVLGVDAGYPLGRDLEMFRLAADGDALAVIDGGPHDMPYRLVRLAGGDGSTSWESAFSFSAGFGTRTPYALAEAPQGRILLAGAVLGEHAAFGRLLEFTPAGAPCHMRDDASLYFIGAATASAEGWGVLGIAAGPSGVSGAAVQRYDAGAPCDTSADAIFSDGFDADPMASGPRLGKRGQAGNVSRSRRASLPRSIP